MAAWKWMAACALALAAVAAPAQAGKAIVVDWNSGLIYPLRNGRLVRSPIITNTGQFMKGKYLGTFSISEKMPLHRSNMYNVHARPIQAGQDGAPMRYWMRIGGTAQGFHLSPLFRADGSRHRSHGCYRLSAAGARWLYGWAPVGTPVYVITSVCHASRFAYLGGSRCRRHVASAGGAHRPSRQARAGRARRRA